MPSLDIVIPAYNAEHCLSRTLESIFRQTVPADLEFGVIVVNNRSTDSTGALIDHWAEQGVRRVDHQECQGRSSTINAGAAASNADFLFILDADCQLFGSDSLVLANTVIAKGIDAGFGYATGVSDDFWGRYQRRLETDRVASGWRGWTTQCCLIRRELFEAIGGFPTEYRYYGFEDRDFVCRLMSMKNNKSLESLPSLRAVHEDEANIMDVFKKMYIAGRYSSEIFKSNFPAEYLETIYASVDLDTAPKYRVLLLRSLQPLSPLLAWIASFLCNRQITPLVVGRPVIKLCSALSYFHGTVDRKRAV